MKSRILFILHLPPPIHGAAIVGTYIHNSKIINKEFNCKYINLALAKDLKDIGKSSIIKFVHFIQKLISIKQTVKKFKPDLCYVTPNAKGGAFYKDFIVVQLLKSMGCKVIVHYHNKGVSTRQNHWFDNQLYKYFFKEVKVILLAKSLYSDFRKYVHQNNLYLCPNGTPQITFLSSVPHNRFNILFLSNMMEEKGVWTLLKACKILKDNHQTFECHFVGKWDDITQELFYNQINKYTLNDCVFAHGAQYGNDKNKYWQRCDLFVFPTYYHNESFPMVLLEAMQQKKACISTYEGGIPEIIIPNQTGYLIPKQNHTLLAEKIMYLINHKELCSIMGENGFARYNQYFTLQKFEEHFVSILKDCLKQ